MFFDAPYGNWVDLAVVVLLGVGVYRGRVRGMSEELLDVTKWILILIAGGFLYQPVGFMLAQSSVFSVFTCFLIVYSTILVVIFFFFSSLKRRLGDKLLASDVFGDAEYYLGMAAGAFRYGCVILVCFAFLNARLYTAEEVAAQRQFQQENFGDIAFPTLPTLQDQVFSKSFVGHITKSYLSQFLILATLPESKGLETINAVRAREQTVNELLEKR